MARKKRETIEFRFYEIPQGESALALYGDKWKRLYGIGEKYLHFHNLFEIGYCHYGHGLLVLDDSTSSLDYRTERQLLEQGGIYKKLYELQE